MDLQKTFCLCLLLALSVMASQRVDHKGRPLDDKAFSIIQKNIEEIRQAWNRKEDEKALVAKIKKFDYLQETFIFMPKDTVNQLWREVKDMDNFFGYLKPMTLYYLWYHHLHPQSWDMRINDIDIINRKLYDYSHGLIDADGNAVTATVGTDAPGGENGQMGNPQGNESGSEPERDPGPLTASLRDAIFRFMPNLPESTVNALRFLHPTFADYILNNAQYAGRMIRSMDDATLHFVMSNVPNFGEILGTSDQMTIGYVFSRLLYPCEYFRSLKEGPAKAEMLFKYQWLENCLPPTTTTTTTTTAAPTTTTTTTPAPTTTMKPLWSLARFKKVLKRIPNFANLIDIKPIARWTDNAQFASSVILLLENATEDDAKALNEIMGELKDTMTPKEASEVFINHVKEYGPGVIFAQFLIS